MAPVYRIRIHAIPLTDEDGDRACTVTPTAFAGAVQEANQVFAPAQVRFDFDRTTDWQPRRDTSLNSLHNGGSQWWIDANQVAAGIRGMATIFLRWGREGGEPADNWFAYPPDTGQKKPRNAVLPYENIDFVAITNQASRFGGGAGFLLAHELGHYLGLFHTHPTWGAPPPELVQTLVEDHGLEGLNGDLLSDTAPDPGTSYYEQRVSPDICGGPAEFMIGTLTVRADRSNVMSYFRCPPVTISLQQVEQVRRTIQHRSRRHLIDGGEMT